MTLKMFNNLESLVDKMGITFYRLHKETGLPRNTVYNLKAHPETLPSPPVINKILNTYPHSNLKPSDFFKIEVIG